MRTNIDGCVCVDCRCLIKLYDGGYVNCIAIANNPPRQFQIQMEFRIQLKVYVQESIFDTTVSSSGSVQAKQAAGEQVSLLAEEEGGRCCVLFLMLEFGVLYACRMKQN